MKAIDFKKSCTVYFWTSYLLWGDCKKSSNYLLTSIFSVDVYSFGHHLFDIINQFDYSQENQYRKSKLLWNNMLNLQWKRVIDSTVKYSSNIFIHSTQIWEVLIVNSQSFVLQLKAFILKLPKNKSTKNQEWERMYDIIQIVICQSQPFLVGYQDRSSLSGSTNMRAVSGASTQN